MARIDTIHADLTSWLKSNLWLVQNGYIPKFHAVIGDTPYCLTSISRRFGREDAAPAKFGTDGAFVRASRGFLGQTWDGFESVYHYEAWVTEWASLLLHYVYPNAVCAFFGGSRTFHRVAAGLEDAGWTIFDVVLYNYNTGFPKSHNVHIDFRKARRGWEGEAISNDAMQNMPLEERARLLRLERQYAGYGSALRPAYEPIILARAPRGDYTLAECADLFNTGMLNIDGTRDERGRYPSNVALDEQASRLMNALFGGAARFFNVTKAQTWEKEAGLEAFAAQIVNDGRQTSIDNPYQRGDTLRRNTHPTVKPIRFTEWLARLLLPPERGESRLLVPFCGVGSEQIGAFYAGWDSITGIEREAEYVRINAARLSWWTQFSSYDAAEKAYTGARNEETQRQLSLFSSPN
jgi:site-specific DNA-methyltransferase (adenine-specific)